MALASQAQWKQKYKAMAYSVDWVAKVFTIPQSDLTFLGGKNYLLNAADAHEELRRLEWAFADGLWAERIAKFYETVTLSGIPKSPSLEIINGYTFNFTGSNYNVIIDGFDTNLFDVYLPANGVSMLAINSVGRQTVTSSGLTAEESGQLNSIDSKTDLIAFLDGVAIDVTNGTAGTGLDSNGNQIGTRLSPSNNLADTKTIADNFGLYQIYVINHISSVTGDFSQGYKFVGDTAATFFLIEDTANMQNCSFDTILIKGELDGLNTVRNATVIDAEKISGSVFNSNLSGIWTLGQTTILTNCGTGQGIAVTILGFNLTATDFHGSITIDGMTGNNSKVEIYGGSVIVNANCTGGTLTITGTPYEIIDNSTGTTVVDLTGDTKTRTTAQIAAQDTGRIEEIHGQVARSVWIDTENPVNGDGYQQSPFNNFTDAVDYAEANGLTNLHILADATVDRQLKNFVITGVGTPAIDTNGQNLDRSEILRCSLTGSYTGGIIAQECAIVGLFTLNGFFEKCAFSADLVVPDGGLALVKDCNSFVVGAVPPQVDIGGVAGTAQLVVTGFDGGMRIVNVNQVTDDVKFLTHVGRVIVDASCTEAQNINVGGVTVLDDFSVGLPPVDVTLDPNDLQFAKASVFNRRLHDKTANTVTLYEPDNVTVKQVWDAPDDLSELTPQ